MLSSSDLINFVHEGLHGDLYAELGFEQLGYDRRRDSIACKVNHHDEGIACPNSHDLLRGNLKDVGASGMRPRRSMEQNDLDLISLCLMLAMETIKL